MLMELCGQMDMRWSLKKMWGGGLFWLCHKWLMDPAISRLLFTVLFNRTVLNNQGEGSRMIDPMIEFTCDSISIESNLAERH